MSILIWILLSPFILILVLLFVIIFLCIMPIRYSVDIKKEDELKLFARVSYMFKLVSVVYALENEKSRLNIRVLWFKFGDDKKPKKRKKIKPVNAASSKEVVMRKLEDIKIETSGQAETREVTSLKVDEKQKEPSIKKEAVNEAEEVNETETDEKPLGKIKNILNKIKAVLTYPQGKTIIKLVFNALKKTGKILWPKYLDLTSEVGFGDPAATGYFIGGFEAVSGILKLRGKRRKLNIYGNFTTDNFVWSIDAKAKGSISILRLSLPFILLIIKKPIRKLIKDILKRNKS